MGGGDLKSILESRGASPLPEDGEGKRVVKLVPLVGQRGGPCQCSVCGVGSSTGSLAGLGKAWNAGNRKPLHHSVTMCVSLIPSQAWHSTGLGIKGPLDMELKITSLNTPPLAGQVQSALCLGDKEQALIRGN